ncbi:MAG: OmpH family outer membrane protein [Bacteroidetes bacterium]|nr:OmpH family outer membrane protein [Bacteroidota bacterium]
MNKIYPVTIGVLFAAVAVLFYLQFKQPGNLAVPKKNHANPKDSGAAATSRLAYIDLDSIKEKYTYFKLRQKELEREKQGIENTIESEVKKLENDRVNFLKRGQSITQQEAEKFQIEYQTRYQALSEKREQLLNQHLSNQSKALDEIQKKINDYLEEYNKTAGYQFIFSTGEGNLTVYYKDTTLNITAEVIEGLNERYKQEQ